MRRMDGPLARLLGPRSLTSNDSLMNGQEERDLESHLASLPGTIRRSTVQGGSPFVAHVDSLHPIYRFHSIPFLYSHDTRALSLLVISLNFRFEFSNDGWKNFSFFFLIIITHNTGKEEKDRGFVRPCSFVDLVIFSTSRGVGTVGHTVEGGRSSPSIHATTV